MAFGIVSIEPPRFRLPTTIGPPPNRTPCGSRGFRRGSPRYRVGRLTVTVPFSSLVTLRPWSRKN